MRPLNFLVFSTAFFALLPLQSCSDVPDVSVPENPGPRAFAPQPDFKKYESLHFVVFAPTYEKASWIGETSENIYRKIMFDTNLLSFKPRENYRITLYRTPEEYRQMTGMPAWSGGGTSTQLLGQVLPEEREEKALTSIATFETVLTPALLAHEITHLVFNEFMEFSTPEDSYSALWLNEGLATYEEMEARDPSERDEFVQMSRTFLKRYALPLDEAVVWRPLRQEEKMLGQFNLRGSNYKLTNVQVWYWQARDVTEFLIRKQGAYKFFVLLDSLKRKRNLSAALLEAYPGNWRSLKDLESEWKQSF